MTESLVFTTVRMYTFLHILTLYNGAVSAHLTPGIQLTFVTISFCYMAKKAMPRLECYFVIYCFKKQVFKSEQRRGGVEIVCDSHILNSQ